MSIKQEKEQMIGQPIHICLAWIYPAIFFVLLNSSRAQPEIIFAQPEFE